MAAEVSSIVRVLAASKDSDGGKRDLVTRDLLGGGGGPASPEAESERPAAGGWDRRLDFLYGQRSCSSPAAQLQDLNLPPSTALDLQLVPPPAVPASAAVCTLEKVKLALERAERESRGKQRRLEGVQSPSPSPSSSSTTSSAKKRGAGAGDDGEESSSSGGDGSGRMMAAGCPQCLLYVLISKSEPRCPRCDSLVPVPALSKRPRIDLNLAQD